MATGDKIVNLDVLKETHDSVNGTIANLKQSTNCNIDAIVGTKGTYVIDPEMIVGAYAAAGTGVITASDEYKHSDYLPTFGGSTLTLSSAMMSLVFYDENKTYISGTTSTTNLTKDIPGNAYYWIVSLKVERTTPTITIAGAVPALKKELQRNHTISNHAIMGEQYPGNLVDPFDWVDNTSLYTSDGKERPNQSGYFCTGFIPVTAGTTYKSNVGRTAVWYNSSKAFVSGVSGTSIQSGITAPETAAYIRFCVSKSSDGMSDPAMLYLTDTTTYSLKTTIQGLNSWLWGKKINWLGDSIVTGAFDEKVCAAMGMTKLTEDGNGKDGGIGGSTIALNEDGTDGRNAICVRYADMPADADIIAVHCGTNDFEYNWSPIGDMSSTANNTFYGALKNLCEGLIRKYPHKLIFFTTPIPRMQPFHGGNGGTYTEDYAVVNPLSKNARGKTLLDYADIIKEVCGYYSIPVLDLTRESGLNACIDYARYVEDNTAEIAYKVESNTISGTTYTYFTHLNELGDKILARRIAGWLIQLTHEIEGI